MVMDGAHQLRLANRLPRRSIHQLVSGCPNYLMNFYNDIDPKACEWLRQLISDGCLPPGDIDNRSITEISPDEIRHYHQCHFFAGIGGWTLALDLAGWDEPCWTGSCPCQPLSIAGLRKGHADERHLWPTLHRLITECRPPTVFGEQVASKDGREWLAAVRHDMEGIGYALGAADLCPTAFDICQHRPRLFFAAVPIGATTTRRGEASRGQRWREKMETHRRYADWRSSCEASVLDDGIPNRMAKSCIKGFGNAIVPEVAAQFVMAASEILTANIAI